MTQQDITDKQVAAFRRAFLDAVQQIKDGAKLSELERLIERQDVDGIMRLLGIDRSAFSGVVDELRQSFSEGGRYGADWLSPIPIDGIGDVVFRFDMSAPSASQWLLNRSSELIVEILDDQKQLIREALAAGTDAGVNPRTQAVRLVGAYDTATKKRTGGIIGLTSQQAGWMQSASDELDGLDSNYLTRQLRDRRFDAAFKKAIESGDPLTSAQKRAMLASLESRTLKYRGDTIARTEAINALRAGQNDALAQAVAKGDIDPQDITKTWDATGDSRTRLTHMLLEGVTIPFGSLFETSIGGQLEYPGDTEHGATGSDTIQCRCKLLYRVDYIAQAMRGFS